MDFSAIFGSGGTPQPATQSVSGNIFGSPPIQTIQPRSVPAQPQAQPQLGQYGQSPVGTPQAPQNVRAATGWEIIIARSGKKDSKKFVAALTTAWNTANLNDEEKYALMIRWKTLPLTDAANIRAQQALNVTAAKDNNGEDILNSRPIQIQANTLEIFISAVTKLKAALGQNGNALKWGTLAQLPYFQNMVAPMMNEFLKIVPLGREMVMRKMFYNLVKFKVGLAYMDLRWLCYSKALLGLKNFGDFETVDAGKGLSNDGRQIVSAHLKFNLTTGSAKKIDIGGQEAATAIEALIKDTSGNDDLTWLFLAAANCPDYRILLQASDVRQMKGNQQFMNQIRGEVMKRMGAVIMLCGFESLLDMSGTYNLEPRGDLCRVYFKARAFCAATLRGINASLFGIAGGADTRSGLIRPDVGLPHFDFNL